MYHPRRTTEMGEGSQSKPARASRIAQPIRRPSTREQSLERAPSLDRLTVGAYMTGSAMKSTKKNSTYTPMRTPSRPIHRPEIVLTSEKEKLPWDKKWIQAQATKISEYLHSVESELGGAFSSKVSLKGMSTKQFLVILSHFFNKVVGNRMSIGANYVDDVAKILSQIGYPYPINKSWLKTPTAPHAFNYVVALLSWLMQFVPNKDALADLGEYIEPSDDFPDKKFAQLFMRRAEEGFMLWNNSKDDELQTLKQSLVDEIIQRETGIQGVKAIEKEVVVLNHELDKLFQKRVVIKREDEFLKLDNEIKAKEKLILKIEESCRKNAQKLNELEEIVDRKDKELADVRGRISELREIIKTQELSVEGREELITKVSNLRRCLDSKKTLIAQLLDMGTENQILLSRLVNQKIEVISKFNKYLYQIFSEPGVNLSVEVKDILLDQNSDEDLEKQLDKVLPLLAEISKKNLEEHRKYSNQISELESQLKLATYTYDTVLQQMLSNAKVRCSELEKNLEEVNKQLINEKWYGEKKIEELTTSLKELMDLNNEMKEKISAREAKLSELQNRNKAMLARIMEKGAEFIREKEKVTDKLCEAIDSFRRTMEDITLQLKDIP